VTYSYELPVTSGPCTEPLAVACHEKLRLRMQFVTVARRFLEALNGCPAPKSRSSGARVHKHTTDEARKACEQAMDALEAHRTEHGC
jgi:hypothetical protein